MWKNLILVLKLNFMQDFEKRLLKLEASNLLYKKILIAIAASSVFLFMAFRKNITAPDVIQAKRFEVVDDNGIVLVRVSQDNGHGLIKTYNTAGFKLLNLTYTTKNEGYIGVENGAGQEFVKMSSSSDVGGGYIGLFNPAGKRIITICNENYGGSFYLSDKDGNSRAIIQNNTMAGGYMSLYNSSGNSAVKLTQTSSGNGDIYVNNYNGDEKIRLSVSTAGGNLQIRNNEKTIAIEAGCTDAKNGIINTFLSGGTRGQSLGQ